MQSPSNSCNPLNFMAKAKKQPPMSDPCWPARCEPLLRFLAKARSWAELTAWRKSIRLNEYDFRNNLAYLEIGKKVYGFIQGKTVYWAQTGVTLPRLVPPPAGDEALLQQLLPESPATAPTGGRRARTLVRSG